MTSAIGKARGRCADLVRFLLLFSALYMGFGVASPFFPAFLASRSISPEQLGLILSLATLVRLFAGPMAGYVADRYRALGRVLAICTLGGAMAAGALGATHHFPVLIAVSLFHAALLAPTTTLADALALRGNLTAGDPSAHFEYGWVRGAGSAAFIAGLLLAGQAVDALGPSAALGIQAVLLASAACIALFVPETRNLEVARPISSDRIGLSTLLKNRPFQYLVLVAAILLGSHAMHDAFAMIAWNAAGVTSSTGSILWSTAVAAEIVVFLLIGPWLLRRIQPTTAMAIAALAAALRWCVMSQTSSISVLALIQPLHGITFALLHLACMRIIVLVTPTAMAASAQAIYALGIGATSAVLTLLSGYLYGRLGLTGFFVMALLSLAALPVIWLLSRSLPNR